MIQITRESKYFNELIELINSSVDKVGCNHNFYSLMFAVNCIELKYNFEIDSEHLLQYMQSNGGYCDCEILMNVDL